MLQETSVLSTGRYQARIADSVQDIADARALRTLAFGTPCPDQDAFDVRCHHVLVHDTRCGSLVCCFRMLTIDGADGVAGSYAAQFYELSALAACGGRMAELGRFCIHPDRKDPDILRLAWGAMTAFVEGNDIGFLFGCASFAGVEPEPYRDAFAMLKARHLAPRRWLPEVKAPHVFRYAARLRHKPDLKQALLRMPPLLRTYLMMGGRVSDHAVVDRQMNTLHVFTGLDIDAIPATRKRLLRAVVK